MRAGLLLISSLALAVTAFAAHSASPADPGVPVAPNRYRPVVSGSKSYRPVEPLPWGEVNRRVAPPPKATGPQGKGAAPAPEHKH
jgi:hypothetical protein